MAKIAVSPGLDVRPREWQDSEPEHCMTWSLNSLEIYARTCEQVLLSKLGLFMPDANGLTLQEAQQDHSPDLVLWEHPFLGSNVADSRCTEQVIEVLYVQLKGFIPVT